jgi:uncharacterized phage-associated protein
MSAATDALAVANFIIEKGREENITIRHLKLQKLLYFCYAWYAGNKGQELFSEDIEAWAFGPVVREVYLKFKDYGSMPIRELAMELDWADDKFVEPKITPALESDLLPVWNEYKRKPDAWLVEATHAKGEPWRVVTDRFGTAEKHQIPFRLIHDVYRKKVNNIAA